MGEIVQPSFTNVPDDDAYDLAGAAERLRAAYKASPSVKGPSVKFEPYFQDFTQRTPTTTDAYLRQKADQLVHQAYVDIHHQLEAHFNSEVENILRELRLQVAVLQEQIDELQEQLDEMGD